MIRLASLVAGALLVVGLLESACASEPGTAYQQHCAACHLPDGAGVPGAYPRLAGRLGTIAASEPGREYLVQVLTKGLMGPMQVEGDRFQGAMPPQALSGEEVAQILNDLVAPGPSGPKAFDAKEVAAIRTKHQGVGMNGAMGLRPAEAAGAKP